MIVDPYVDLGAPEVCDGCAFNCHNLWNICFDRNHEFIDGFHDLPPSFGYSYFINSIIRPTSIDVCEENHHDSCVYSLHDPSVPHSLREWLTLKGLDASEGIRSIMSPRSVFTVRELVGYP